VYLSYLYFNFETWQAVAIKLLDFRKNSLEPNLIEKIFGYFTLFITGVLICFKSHSEQLIFIFNPCHIILVIYLIIY